MRVAMNICAFALAAALAAHATPAAAVQPNECTTERLRAVAPADTTVAIATREGGGCRVTGYVTTQDPGPNQVLFMLMLPDNFNGRYLYLGVGGAAGQLPTANAALLRQGYAMAGSDAGAGPRSGADYNFTPAQEVDYYWRGVHVSAVATQQITRRYYQRDAMHRYISGCSGGGQMGVTNAARFGRSDFDGFLVGAAPLPAPQLFLPYMFTIAQRLQNNPAGWISPELLTRAQTAILARYDGIDGVSDGIIADPRDIANFDVGILRELGFTPAQIETFQYITSPPRFPRTPYTPAANPPGFPVTTVSGWGFLTGRTMPPWANTETVSATDLGRAGAPFPHIMMDSRTRAETPGRNYAAVTNMTDFIRLAIRDGKDAPYPDPSVFSQLRAQGGRMIVYHGANDASIPVATMTGGYASLAALYPDAPSWIRAYSVPGMQHCAGGPGPTEIDQPLLAALVAWVENGTAPEGIVAPRQTPARGLEREFLICPEPRRPRLRTAGLDPMRAENWECRAVGATG